MSFGERIAEQEEKQLAKYFVETEQWRQIYGGDVDVVYGPKGSGKSALFALLQDKKDELFTSQILITSGENPRGDTVFKDLVDDPPTSEAEFVNLWKLYLLTLVGTLVREYAAGSEPAKKLIGRLEDARLLPFAGSLKSLLRAVQRYVRPAKATATATVDEITYLPKFEGCIVFREPEYEEKKQGAISI